MILFPFKNVYLKSTLSRTQIQEKLAQVTFLIGDKQKQENRTFYGTATTIDFNLQNVLNTQLCAYVQGTIYGQSTETYLHLVLKGFKHRRVYLLLLLLWLVSTAYLITQIYLSFQYIALLIPAIASFIICLILLLIMHNKTKKFNQSLSQTQQYFTTLLQATPIAFSDIPQVLISPN